MRRFDPAPISRAPGVLHRLDGRTRLICALLLLVGISLGQGRDSFVPIAVVTMAGLLAANVRLRRLWVRATAVLTFPLVFVLLNYLGGEAHRAELLLLRSVLSAGVLLVLTAVTPLPELSSALSRLGAPAVLTETVTLVYRYLFVLTDQAMRMRDALQCRGGSGSVIAAGGTVGVLFARSYARAESVHRAMLSRGYTGVLPSPASANLRAVDFLFIAVCACAAFTGSVIHALG